MEISTKKLHLHAVPILIIIVGVLAATAVWTISQTSSNRLIHGLLTSTVRITPSRNGLAHITAQYQTNPGSDIQQAGRNASLNLEMH
jgi:hypothetical protein